MRPWVLLVILLAGCASPGPSSPDPDGQGDDAEQLPRAGAPLFATAEDALIRPGERIRVSYWVTEHELNEGGSCTLNAFFQSEGQVYASTAAHCVRGEGATEVIQGHSQDDLGQAIVTYSSFTAMNTTREEFEELCLSRPLGDGPDCWNDFALLALPPELVALSHPSIPVIGGPAGLNVPAVGDPYVLFGRSPQRPLRNVAGDEADVRHGVVIEVGEWYVLGEVGYGLSGDSGGPALTLEGGLFGMTNWLITAKMARDPESEPPSEGMMRIDTALAWAIAHGAPDVAMIPAA